MAKPKTLFVCQQCGVEFPKWLGRCSECGEWNSLVEVSRVTSTRPLSTQAPLAKPQKFSQIKSVKRIRLKTGIVELDRVLGGGIIPGSVVLLAGEPGIGKSTLMLQLAGSLSQKKSKAQTWYVSGEESLQQTKIRAERLGIKSDNLLFLAEADVDRIIETFNQGKDSSRLLVIIDSVQTLFTARLSGVAGSVGQVRESTALLLKYAKQTNVPLFLVGHVTKEGAIAGPKILEHMVDTVVYFEGEKFGSVRLLRATKNRFGPTDEVGIFEMTDKGLVGVTNPSKLFLKGRGWQVPGSVAVATIEGTRSVLVEIQALVVPTQLSVPRRVSQGIDYHRLLLISAVLSRRLGLPMAGFDIYVKITSGLRIEEPAADLGVALAIISSFKNKPMPAKTICFGEVGLLGEIREASQANQRVKEAKRLGFETVISSANFHFLGQAAKALFR
ncbi:MAG TPA: DNA repair protein RadA [Nevskiaceae bacterium]|nr:DNA repair protein RadA [Nevskiaceae bacterium]